MKGLSLSEPMMLAWIAGNKTVTRRLMNPQPVWIYGDNVPVKTKDADPKGIIKPRYLPGDTVYIKEVWRFYDWTEDGYPFIQYRCDGAVRFVEDIPDKYEQWVFDTWAKLSSPDNFKLHGAARDNGWRSPMMMPEWASRSHARIISIRPERVQSITAEEAIKEGIRVTSGARERFYDFVIRSEVVGLFQSLWETIHPGTWDQNPWVWRYDLEKLA